MTCPSAQSVSVHRLANTPGTPRKVAGCAEVKGPCAFFLHNGESYRKAHGERKDKVEGPMKQARGAAAWRAADV